MRIPWSMKVLAYVSLILLWSGHKPLKAETTPLVPVKLALQWLPQSQFAGYYFAVEKGFFRDAGFDVTLLHTGPGPSSLDYLVAGQVQFSTLFLTDALVNGREPVQVVQLAQVVQRSNLMLVAWKDMGITKETDLDGRRVSFWPGSFSVSLTAFFHQQGIKPIELAQNYSINLFLQRAVTACSAMEYNELHRIYQSGVDFDRLTLFLMRDYQLGFPEDGLYVTADYAVRNPKLCIAFRDAALAGWEYARQHQKEAHELVLRESRKAGVPTNLAHIRWMLDRILPSIFVEGGAEKLFHLDSVQYQKTVDALKMANLVMSALPFEQFAPFEADVPK